MKYIQIDIEVKASEIEQVTGFLMMHDITDTVVEDPKDLDRLLNKEVDYEWDYISQEVLDRKDSMPKITFYLEYGEEERASKIADAVKKEYEDAIVKITIEDDSQWKDKWKEFFKPARVSERIVVKPTWEEYRARKEDLVIEIDPGMAFGTGTHETTSLCLKLMEKYLKPSQKVLDVGCGSGILSIGAAILGAGETLAIDIDPEAVKVSKDNIVLNGCEDRVKIQYGNLVEGIEFKADLIVANLMADLVVLLSKHAVKHLKAGGIYISSGILIEKKEEVTKAIIECGFEIAEIREDGMWCAIAAVLPKEEV